MDLFDIVGPTMVGPSSSHTAGAVRIGYVAGQLPDEPIKRAEILLYGSFLATGDGHGTRKAIVAGLLGMKPDDYQISDSFESAQSRGIEITFGEARLEDAHPNTAVLLSYAKDYNASEEQMVHALYVAAGIGKVIAENAFLAGAAGGCHAEIGSASAMAAGALAYLQGGDAETVMHAFLPERDKQRRTCHLRICTDVYLTKGAVFQPLSTVPFPCRGIPAYSHMVRNSESP